MTGNEDLCFIEKQCMTSVYDMTDILDLPGMAYDHFINFEDEILYLTDMGKLMGILTISDVEQFYNYNYDKLVINTRYPFLNAIDFDVAAAFFDRVETADEIPVITKDGGFYGCIKRKKPQYFWIDSRYRLKAVKTGKFRWHREEIRRFVNETKASVFIYTHSNAAVEHLDQKEKEKINRRNRNIDRNIDNSMWEILSESEWDVFLGTKEHMSDGRSVLQKERSICVPSFINGRAFFSDMEGEYFTIRNGYRITPNNSPDADRRIFMFGPCFVFGAYCKDSQTIEAYLQDMLNRDGYRSWKVLNRGMCDPEFCYDQLFMEDLSEDDVVIIMGSKNWILSDQLESTVVFTGDLSGVLEQLPHLTDCILDNTFHCNYIANECLANKIYADICSIGILEKPRRHGVPKKIQDYYISWPVQEYFSGYFERYKLCRESGRKKVGAVVMNCNPFTKGHRYLIEQAVMQTDILYVFVVEEDKSCFGFDVRMKMVEDGVSGIENVKVVPSGRYIISSDTFAQYFEKEQVQAVESMDYDLHIFGEVVAPALGITYRFVGEEPFDKVTREYNKTMKRILPNYGVKVIEFPRIAYGESREQVVSASSVRKALQNGNWDAVEQMCPLSTIKYLGKWVCE